MYLYACVRVCLHMAAALTTTLSFLQTLGDFAVSEWGVPFPVSDSDGICGAVPSRHTCPEGIEQTWFLFLFLFTEYNNLNAKWAAGAFPLLFPFLSGRLFLDARQLSRSFFCHFPVEDWYSAQFLHMLCFGSRAAFCESLRINLSLPEPVCLVLLPK